MTAPDIAYCDHCGKPVSGVDHSTCAAARELEPPRYCAECARRLVVQVTPNAWTASCSRHGSISG